MTRTISRLLAVVMVFSLLCGCEKDDGSDYIFKYDIQGNPRTLDPQSANDESSQLIISNMFEGLLSLDTDGNIVSGVAGEYFVSDDCLTYTFKLRDDYYWYNADQAENETPLKCTAYDFVFAFQRLMNPATKSKNAEQFYCIKNAKRINTNRFANINTLGVEAISDYELVITLEYANPMFEELLTTAPAMPCNEEFYYSTKGRYGLSASSLLSNGSFYLYKWNYDKYSSVDNSIILRRNKPNSALRKVYPYGLNFFIDEQDSLGNFLGNASHSYIASGREAIALSNEGYPHYGYENSTWGITFNTRGVFHNANLRLALATSFSPDDLNFDTLGYTKANVLIPDIVKVGSLNYRQTAKEVKPPHSATSRALYEKGLEESRLVSLTKIDVIMEENSVLEEQLSQILQKWQKELLFYCNIKEYSRDEMNARLSEGNYDIALIKLVGEYNSPSAYLRYFTETSKTSTVYENSDYHQNIYDAEHEADDHQGVSLYQQAESQLLSDAIFIPLCFQTEYFFYQNKCQDISYNPFTGAINYSQAKYFD